MSDPETLEALACMEGLSLAADLLVQRLRLATDCINVVRSLESGGKGPYGQVLQEIRARATEFQSTSFVHERRSANVDAHNLARGSIYLDIGRHVWFLSPPEGVCNRHNTS